MCFIISWNSMYFHLGYVIVEEIRDNRVDQHNTAGYTKGTGADLRVAVIWTLCESRRASVSVCGNRHRAQDVRPLYCLHNARFNKSWSHASSASRSHTECWCPLYYLKLYYPKRLFSYMKYSNLFSLHYLLPLGRYPSYLKVHKQVSLDCSISIFYHFIYFPVAFYRAQVIYSPSSIESATCIKYFIVVCYTHIFSECINHPISWPLTYKNILDFLHNIK